MDRRRCSSVGAVDRHPRRDAQALRRDHRMLPIFYGPVEMAAWIHSAFGLIHPFAIKRKRPRRAPLAFPPVSHREAPSHSSRCEVAAARVPQRVQLDRNLTSTRNTILDGMSVTLDYIESLPLDQPGDESLRMNPRMGKTKPPGWKKLGALGPLPLSSYMLLPRLDFAA